MSEKEIEKKLKKDLVRQLQGLKQRDQDRLAFHYELRQSNLASKKPKATVQRKSLAKKRRFYELIA